MKVIKEEEEEQEKPKEQTGRWEPGDDSRTGRGGRPVESRSEGTFGTSDLLNSVVSRY